MCSFVSIAEKGVQACKKGYCYLLIGLLLGAWLLPAITTQGAPLATYDLSRDFSTNSNPAGVWSYGWKSDFTGKFTLYTYFKTDRDILSPPGANLDVWSRYSDDASQIHHNGSTLTAIAQHGEGVFPPGSVVMIPGRVGRGDNYSVARFTAPVAGNYLISSAVQNMFHGPSSGDTDFHVLRDGVELYGAWLPGDTGAVTNEAGYTNQVILEAGSTIELLCGRGLDDVFEGTGIKIQSTISLLATNVYDLAHDFSTNSNPAGVWSYGWKSNYTGAFNLLTYFRRTADSSRAAYVDMWTRFSNDQTAIWHNSSGVTAISEYGQGVYPPETVVFVPGINGRDDNFGVVRFTAPFEGTYLIGSAVRNMLHGSSSGDTDFHVLQDGVELFGAWMPGDTGSVTNRSGYTNEVALAAGGTIEFLVGRGADGRFEGSGLMIQATITLLNASPAAPRILQEPLQQIVPVGGNATFSATATGSPTLAYQWRFNGSDIPGATNSSLSLTNVQPAQAGAYSVVISNAAGSVTSSNAVLSVTPALTTWDVSRDYSTDSNPAGVWSYGWKSDFTGAFNLFTFYKRTIDPISPPGAYIDIWQRFTNDQSAVWHNGTDLTVLSTYGQGVYPPGTVLIVPGNNGRNDNFGVVRFTAPFEGTYLISSAVQSMLHGSMSGDTDFHVLQDGVELFGAWMPGDTGSVTNRSGYTNEVALKVGGTIEFLVGRGADGRHEGSGLKIQATINLLNEGPAAPWIIQEPLQQIVSVGGSAAFSATAGGSAPLSYQWQFNGVNLTNTTWIRGANESILRIQNVQAANAGNYTLKVSNPVGEVSSSSAPLIVHNPPAVGITTPIEGEQFLASTKILISAEAFDMDDNIQEVEFYAQQAAPGSEPVSLGVLTNAAVRANFSAQIIWPNVAAGAFKLTAVAVDTLGGKGTSAPVSITVINPEPMVRLDKPKDRDVFSPGANIPIQVYADGVGNSTVERVEFLVGTNVIGAITNGYYSYSLTWSNVPEGLYTITARAIDNNGGVGISSPVNIRVGNPLSQPVFRFDTSSYTVNEEAGFVWVTVLKNVGLPASVNYATTDESAIALSGESGDYVSTTGHLDFAERETSISIPIRINDDSQLEGSETFTICLSSPSNGGILAEPSCATITILDNDANLGSCPTNVPPSPIPSTIGSLRVDLEPPEARGQWRFAWETAWRNNGAIVSGLARGNYEIEYKPVSGFIAPNPYILPVDTNGLVLLTNYYDPTSAQQYGALAITVEPNDVATNSEIEFRGQWRLEGEENWRQSGETVSNLLAGIYLVQFKPVRGRTTPPDRKVQVGADQLNTLQATYLIAPEVRPDAILPHPLEFAQITNSYTSGLPYAFNGQIKSDVGWASGFLVKERVVLTAAHVVFDDASLSYVTGVRWFFQKHANTYEPAPQSPRGWYVRSGYAMERTNTPGNASAFSQKLDFAALYFTKEDAGRGGYGGYLVSEPDGPQWLKENANKILVGYPVAGIAECTPGIMHTTDPYNMDFFTVLDGLYRTSDILSLPGNSGGPLCVQYTNGCYYPAAICLGGSGETIVRTIDATVADLINQAEISSHGGENHVGGGVITVISAFNGNQFCSGSVSVKVGPRSVVNAGGAWRVSPAYTKYSNYTNFSARTDPFPVQNGDFAIEFADIPGFTRPTNSTVQVYCNQGVTIAANYQVVRPTIQWVSADSVKLKGTKGTSYRIDYTESLGSNPVWKPVIMSVTLTNEAIVITEVNSTNRSSGFYRTVWLP